METVNKRELARRTAYRAGVSVELVHGVIGAMAEEVKAAVVKNERVVIVGLGVFEGRDRAPQVARNLATGGLMMVPARKTPVFRPSTEFRKRLHASVSADVQEEA